MQEMENDKKHVEKLSGPQLCAGAGRRVKRLTSRPQNLIQQALTINL